jgi:membrane protein
MNKIKKSFSELWHILRLPEMLILPGNIAFYLILSLIPIISVIGLITASINLSTTGIVDYFNSILPSEIVDMLVGLINREELSTTSIIFLVIGFYAASNGPDSLITASSILYKTDNNNYVFRRVKALFMTFFLILLFIFILIVLAFGNIILTKVLNFGVLGKIITNNYGIITILKFVLSFIFIFLTVKIIYTMSCSKVKSKYVNKGSLFSTVAIIVVTTIYSFYVTNIANYNILYGSLSSIAVLMFLIYFISYILVLGIAINHQSYNIENNN